MTDKLKFCYEFPRAAVAADNLIISGEGNEKEILLIKRKHDPYKDQWALPGGFMDMDETAEEAAARELKEETGVTISASEMKFVHVFSKVHRDPRTRLISLAFTARVKKSEIRPKAGDDAKETRWFNLNQLPELAFDHAEIIECAKQKKML